MSCANPDCCEKMAHTMEVKICKACSQPINNWNCQLCDICSINLQECGHCRQSLIFSIFAPNILNQVEKRLDSKIVERKPKN